MFVDLIMLPVFVPIITNNFEHSFDHLMINQTRQAQNKNVQGLRYSWQDGVYFKHDCLSSATQFWNPDMNRH